MGLKTEWQEKEKKKSKMNCKNNNKTTTEWQGLLENSNAKGKGQRKGEPKTCWKHLPHEGFQKKETLSPPSPWKQLKVHFQTDQKKQENKRFLSFVFPSCHPTSFTSKHVTAQNRMRILWHRLEQRQDDSNNHGGNINRFSSNFWRLLPSPHTGGGIKGSYFPSTIPELQHYNKGLNKYFVNDSGHF